MKRLRDELGADDPDLRAGAQVLSRIAPLTDDPQRQARVRLRLGSPRRRPAVLALLPRPAVAVAILLASAVGGGAMAGGGWQYAREHVAWIVRLDSPRAPAPRTDAARRAPARASSEAPAPAPRPTAPTAPPTPAAEPVANEPVVVTDAVTSTAPGAANPPREQRRGAHRRFSGQPTGDAARPAAAIAEGLPLAPTGPGASLVLEAMQARRAGDDARTDRLLTEYRTRYPNGALVEEALALALEGAIRRGDDKADALAQQYLSRFPNGRYRQHVERLRRTPAR